MKEEHYTLHYQSRPLRWAFLINESLFGDVESYGDQLLNLVVDYNNTHWGGRENPIIIFEDDKIESSDWHILRTADPDGITILGPAENSFVKKVQSEIRPIGIDLIDEIDDNYKRIELPIGFSGIRTPPNKANLDFFRNRNLFLAEFPNDDQSSAYNFIHRNFGTYSQWIENTEEQNVRRIAWLENCLDGVKTIDYQVADNTSQGELLTSLVGRLRKGDVRKGLPFLFPSSLSMSGLRAKTKHGDSDVYHLFLGDSPRDFSSFWNSVHLFGGAFLSHEHYLWVSEKLAFDDQFQDGLLDWLGHYTNYGAPRPRTEIHSQSISSTRLSQLRQRLLSKKHVYGIGVRRQLDIRRQGTESEQESLKNSLVYDRILKSHNTFSQSLRPNLNTLRIPPPGGIKQDFVGSGTWMTDVIISESHGRNPYGNEQVWQLPKRQSSGLLKRMFRNPVRINAEGIFCCSVEHDPNGVPSSIPNINVSIPDKRDLFYFLLLTPNHKPPFYKPKTSEKNIVHKIDISEKGQYLDGFIGLFNGLENVQKLFVNRFWITAFKILSGQDPRKDYRLHESVTQLIAPHIVEPIESEANEDEPLVEGIASNIISQIRGRLKTTYWSKVDINKHYNKISSPPKYGDFVQGKTQLNTIQSKYSRSALWKDFDRLLAYDILKIGTELICPACKLTKWHPIDELQQHKKCSGCGNDVHSQHDPDWSYTLNTLVEKAVGQGIIAVAQALACIKNNSHSFFSCLPSIDIYKNRRKEPFREVDYLCVSDGAFIIGEAKESHIQEAEVKALTEAALAIKPDRAYITMYREKSRAQIKEINDWMREANSTLNPVGTSMHLFEIPVFPAEN